MGQADITRKKAIVDFLQKVLPEPASHAETDAKKRSRSSRRRRLCHRDISNSGRRRNLSALYEMPKPRFTIREISDDNDDDVDGYDDDFVKGDSRAFCRGENVGSIASPYILPYLSKRHRRRHLDIRYYIRKDGDSFKIGDSTVLVDTDSDITIKGKEFRGTTGLWLLWTRKSVDRRKVTTDDLNIRKYWS